MIKELKNIKRRDPEPTITRLEILVESIKDGKIKLPNFQRPFVWQKSDILNLLDSVYRGYPIGSILLWSTTEKLSSERSILESLDLSTEDSGFQSEYLLDGQQRLTSICGVLYWDGVKKTNKWNVYFDLENEEFVYSENKDLVNLFPLNKLLETRSFLKECMKFEHHSKSDIFYQRAENLLKAIKDYKIAVVKIGDMKLEEVAPVFERINSRGRVLTMLDLMRAATWKGGFDLTEKIDNIILFIHDAGFGEISSDVVLKCISASAGKGFNKADIDKLRDLSPDELFKASEDAKKSILASFNFLREVARITDVSFVPYFQQIVLLAEFFRLSKTELTRDKKEHLKSWFWVTSISKHFSGASTGDNTRELARIREYAIDKIGDIHPLKKLDLEEFLMDDYNLRLASSSTISALLNIGVGEFDLLGNNIEHSDIRKSKDHFKPLFTSSKEGKLNIARVLCKGKRDVGIEDLESLTDAQLKENFLSKEVIKYIKKKDYNKFVSERSKIFLSYVRELVKIDVSLDL